MQKTIVIWGTVYGDKYLRDWSGTFSKVTLKQDKYDSRTWNFVKMEPCGTEEGDKKIEKSQQWCNENDVHFPVRW